MQSIQVTDADVMRAIDSFPAGSAGGPDGVRPQQIKDLVHFHISGAPLLRAISGLINKLLKGYCPEDICLSFLEGISLRLKNRRMM